MMGTVEMLPVPLQDLGECPFWNPVTQHIEWIDVTEKKLLSAKIDGADFTSTPLDNFVGLVLPRTSGGQVIAYRRKLVLTDVQGNIETEIVVDQRDEAAERFNDGACDSRGRLWVGTMDKNISNPLGALYKIDPDGRSRKMADGLILANGIAWSPDETLMYQCDSGLRQIFVHRFDAESGTIGPRQVFVEFDGDDGMPDGCATDSLGQLWVASPGTGSIIGFSSDGSIIARLEVPTKHPTSVAFGGTDGKTLIVTSMKPRHGAAEVKDGGLFTVRMEIGAPPRFAFGG